MHSICRPIRIFLPLSFFACLLVSCASTQDSQTVEQRLDQYLHSFPEPFNGSILVAVGDNVLIQKGYGWANREFGIPNDPDTKFSIGSITKQFTDMLVLQMVEEGLIDLGATVSDYLPYYPAAHREVFPSVEHRTGQYENDLAEVSHQHTREQERQMHRFKPMAHPARKIDHGFP